MDFFKALKINKHELGIGLSLCFWIVLFLILAGPFDVSEVSVLNRFVMMPAYGVILLMSYLVTVNIHDSIFDSSLVSNLWSLKHEFFFVFILFFTCFFPSFLYYSSDFIQGEYTIRTFLINIYTPFLLVFMPIVLMTRWLVHLLQSHADKAIELGKNQYDRIRLKVADLVFVKASDNYVEIHYLDNHEMKLKLIRSTLKEVKLNIPELVQTHRSYLVNSDHFITWKDKNNISLTASEIPVSNTYRNDIGKLL